tara:strand:- start:83 stop:391 length:309 start_codon:yes stop_codon:yes gene_type:complete
MSKQMKKYNSDFKLKVVLKYLTGNSTISQLCQEFEISKATLNNWNKQFKENSSTIFSDAKLSQSGLKFKKEQKEKDKQISNLYKTIGQLTVERDFLKKVLDA